MSLLTRIVALIHELQKPGGVSVDDLQPYFPEATRRQITQAVANAKSRNKVAIVTRGRSLGVGQGTTPCTYGPPEKEEAEPEPVLPDPTPPRGELGRLGRISSVWELGRTA